MTDKKKLIPTAFLIFGLICGVFGFFTGISNKFLWISSTFYLQISMVSLLAAIYFQSMGKK